MVTTTAPEQDPMVGLKKLQGKARHHYMHKNERKEGKDCAKQEQRPRALWKGELLSLEMCRVQLLHTLKFVTALSGLLSIAFISFILTAFSCLKTNVSQSKYLPYVQVVQQGYKVCSLAAQLMHPLAVWDAICCGGCSYGGLSRGLPQHFQAELHSIVDALWHNYSAVAELVQGVVSAAITACVAAGDQICAAGSPALVAAAQEEAERGTPDAQAKVEATTAALRALAGLEDAAEAGAEQKDESAAADSVAARKRACLVAAAAAAAAAAQAAHGVPPEAFVKALCCALSTLCTQPPAMFYDQSQSGQSQTLSYKQSLRGKSSKGRCPPQLRCLLLECVKPQVDGHLPGYAPSPSFAQTFAKGWAKGPEVGRIAEMVNRPPSWLDLPDDLGLSVLSHLEDGKDLARVLLASK
eukprot:scaffold92574_cov18-Tisochrysis_lutea.AAC.1